MRVTGVELDRELARFAAGNARSNSLEQRCRIVRADLRDAPRFLPPEHFHRVVANPPYRRRGSGATPPDPRRAAARQELTFSLADLAGTASALLRFGGTLCVIHLAERLQELFKALDRCNLAPKQLRLVASCAAAAPRLCLVSAVKGARPGLSVLPQLVLHEPGGHPRRHGVNAAGEAPRAGRPGQKTST